MFQYLRLLTFTLIAITASLSPIVSAQEHISLTNGLMAKAQAQGSVRIIIQVKETKIPSGRLSNPNTLSQMHRIASVQDRVLARLSTDCRSKSEKFKYIPAIASTVTQSELAALLNDPDIVSVQEDYLSKPSLAQSIPLVNADDYYTEGFSGTGQAIAVLDTGVQTSHPFFGDRTVSEGCFSNANGFGGQTSVCPGGVNISTAPGSGTDCSINGCSHGTHVAGIALGNNATSNGVARTSSLIAMQVFTRFDSEDICGLGNSPCLLSYNSDQIRALERVLELHNDPTFTTSIASVNMSLGGGGPFNDQAACDASNFSQKAAIDNLRSVGIATLIASGNEFFTTGVASPSCISSAIAVGSTTKSDTVSSFSNSGSLLDILAPGSSIRSSVPGNGFAFFSGTSMAAPHVAGTWAALKEKAPLATVSQIYDALNSSGVPILDTRNGLTFSRIDLQAASLELNKIVSGTVYSDQGVTNLGAVRTVTVALNGVSAASALTNVAGQFSVTLSTAPSTGDIITAYLDDEIENGVTVVRSNGVHSADVDIFQNFLLLQSKDGNALTNSNLNIATNSGDSDIAAIFSVTSGNLTVASGIELFIPSGTSFTPGGAIDLNADLNLDGTLSLDSNDLNISGDWKRSNLATFNADSSTIIFDGSNQDIFESNSFFNLTKSVSSAATLGLEQDETQIVVGALTLQGSPEELLSLRAVNSAGAILNDSSQSTISPQAAVSASFLNVRDQINGGSTIINPSASTNAGNNSNWFDGSDHGEDDIFVSLVVDTDSIGEDSNRAVLTAILTEISDETVTVTIAYSGTASSSDYAASSQIIVLPGELSASIFIESNSDSEHEEDERIVIDISSVVNGIENGVQRQIITIVDDDQLDSSDPGDGGESGNDSDGSNDDSGSDSSEDPDSGSDQPLVCSDLSGILASVSDGATIIGEQINRVLRIRRVARCPGAPSSSSYANELQANLQDLEVELGNALATLPTDDRSSCISGTCSASDTTSRIEEVDSALVAVRRLVLRQIRGRCFGSFRRRNKRNRRLFSQVRRGARRALRDAREQLETYPDTVTTCE